MKNYKELIVWQKGMNLTDLVYALTRKLPPEELYGLISQLRRSAISIPSNIAEGYGRGSTKDYIRFLKTSRGSLYELETQLLIAVRQEFLTDSEVSESLKLINEIERMLNSLIAKLQQ